MTQKKFLSLGFGEKASFSSTSFKNYIVAYNISGLLLLAVDSSLEFCRTIFCKQQQPKIGL